MSLQPKPDSKKYTDLISEIQKGEIKIPKFQRNFVWSIEKTAKLLDSILKGYPIGTFILWETKERLNDIKNIGDLELPPSPEGTKVQYVLDGQQRITSLYAAFLGANIQKEGEKKITDYKEIYVDLEKDFSDIQNNGNEENTPKDDEETDEIVTNEIPSGTYISLHKILNALKYDDEIEDEFDRDYRKKIRKYAQVFSTYDFSTIVLRKEDIDSAIEVFTRINTGGQTLTLYEIMSAKTYDEIQKFDMEEKFQSFLEELSDIKYNSISSSVILSTLSLVLSKNKECKRKTILLLDKQKIIDTWDKVVSALKDSIDYFRSVYRIPVSAILPYDSLLVPFSYFFYYHKERPKGEQIKYLEEFFWRVSLSFRYSSSTESKLAQDIKKIDDILIHKRPSYDEFKVYLNSPKDLIDIGFSAGSSYCKAILCLLAYHEPKDFRDNGRVILDNSWLKVANSKNYHHFFPRAHLKKKNIGNENSLVNISLVSADLNKRKIRSKPPSVYIQEFWDENDELPTTLKSHLINDIDYYGISSDDYDVFLQMRAEKIFNELKDRIELTRESDKKEAEIKEMILGGESDLLEFKSSLRYDMKIGNVNKKLEFVVAKTISAFLNSEGGHLIIGVDDDGNILGLEKDFSTLKKGNKDDFELHLRQIIKKYLSRNFEKHLRITFPKIANKIVCLIKVMQNVKSVFVTDEGKEFFFIRNGNASIPLNRLEQSDYEKLRSY